MSDSQLPQMGKRLKTLRRAKFPGDDQKRFAARIKVSRATYQKMEKGDLSIAFASYYAAALMLGVEDQFSQLFELPVESVDLLEELEL